MCENTLYNKWEIKATSQGVTAEACLQGQSIEESNAQASKLCRTYQLGSEAIVQTAP